MVVFDTRLFCLIALVSSVALVIAVPRQVRSLLAVQNTPPEADRRHSVTTGASLIPYLFLVAGSAALGTALSPRIGLGAPTLAAVAHGALDVSVLVSQVLAAAIVGVGSMMVFLPLYYGVFRPRLDPATVRITEALRVRMGVLVRVLMGGVIEEVIFRWGVMTICAWLVIGVFGFSSGVGMWTSIFVAGIVFGLAHLPGATVVGVPMTRVLVTMTVVLNLTGAIAFGWLFWRYGLLAAIIAHGLVHLIWFPFDRRAIARVDRDLQVA